METEEKELVLLLFWFFNVEESTTPCWLTWWRLARMTTKDTDIATSLLYKVIAKAMSFQ